MGQLNEGLTEGAQLFCFMASSPVHHSCPLMGRCGHAHTRCLENLKAGEREVLFLRAWTGKRGGWHFSFFGLIYLLLAALGLCCCSGFSLVAASRVYSLAVVPGLLIVVAFAAVPGL